MILKNLVEPQKYIVAEYNRLTTDMNEEEKSDRLWRMMVTNEVQTMICKKIEYRNSRRLLKKELGEDPPWYKLFDGCHRKHLTEEFLAGLCYVKIHNKKDNCDYFYWNTEEAVNAVKEYKEYNLLLSEEWRERLLDCPTSMIVLDPKMSDTEAYHRARVANQCKALSNAQIMKCMCSKNTVMANLLSSMNECDNLSVFLDDEIYRYNISLIRMFVENSFDTNFTPNIAMLQSKNAIERAEELINDDEKPHDDIFVAKVLDATRMARSIVNEILTDHKKTIRKNNTHQSAIGLIYLSLSLACANANESVLTTTKHISKESVKQMFDVYIGLDKSQKGDNHKRIYTYFTTGTFPKVADGKKSKKQKIV